MQTLGVGFVRAFDRRGGVSERRRGGLGWRWSGRRGLGESAAREERRHSRGGDKSGDLHGQRIFLGLNNSRAHTWTRRPSRCNPETPYRTWLWSQTSVRLRVAHRQQTPQTALSTLAQGPERI